MLKIPKCTVIPNKTIIISGSKSESNRLLILQKLFRNIEIENLSNSQDTQILHQALTSKDSTIDIHHTGTAMRFLTSYFAIQEGKTTILTGSERMKQRPIQSLVEALNNLGAKIEYLEKEGFPPLKIQGKKLIKNSVEISANISSQFITSLILIGAKLESGLEITLKGKITSLPYLQMTLKLLSKIGIEAEFESNIIKIKPLKTQNKISYKVESDWSSASYFYSLIAISKKNIFLENFKPFSKQGDAILSKIYHQFFGIETIFNNSGTLELKAISSFQCPPIIELDMNHCPDIAQTVCVTASALKIPFKIIGLETLKIKETDRLTALQNELKKLGVQTQITENSIQSLEFTQPDKKIVIETYQDHRMAMSFAPFALIQEIEIQNHNVVEKSYPNFWMDFEKVTQPVINI